MKESQQGSVHPAIAALATGALAAHGIEAPRAEQAAAVSVYRQRAVLQQLASVGGPTSVLMAGSGLRQAADHPLVLVLLNSETIADLLEKIDRLNRYFHSHHRHVIHHQTAHSIELEHTSRDGASPLAVESLFVAGIYLYLLEQIGCIDLRVRFPRSEAPGQWIAYGADATGVPHDGTQLWSIRWDEFRQRRALPGLDNVLLDSLPLDLEQRSSSEELRFHIASDIARRWTLSDAAAIMGLSTRSVQRRLREEGTSFSKLVIDSRVLAAENHLAHPQLSVTDIGYLVGFSDTAHFTRTFKASTGLTPTQWRSQASG